MESESGAAAAVPPEQELTEALLSLSWPLPRTVEDADAALTRLEEVTAVLTRLEQQSVGSEAWWAGQVDGLATQSGFVLEWWRPVLRDPDLDWTLNHQAHLTADLATLASAGARLLDQIEPRAEEAAAVHARRAEQEKRWGPTAVPPFPPSGPKPQPPQQVFGEPQAAAESEQAAGETGDELNVPLAFPPIPPPQKVQQGQQAPAAYDAPPVAAPPSIPGQPQYAEPAEAEQGPGPARHRRPVYDFDDAGHAPSAHPPAVYPPPAGPAPRSPLVPGPGFGGPPQGRTLAPGGGYPPPPPVTRAPVRMHSAPATSTGPFGFVGEDDDDDEPESLVPSGLRRHQRRLLVQTGVILGAIGVLCWLAIEALSGSPSHPAAASDTTHTTAAKTTPAANGGTVAGGLTNQNPTPTSSATAKKTTQASPTPSAAPSTAQSSVPDATSVNSVHVTLLGGSSTVPQIVALITVDTAGSGQLMVTGSYYGASGSKQVAAESEQWVLSGKTEYQYSVPIANSAYCGTEFHFTVSAGGHSQSGETSPGC